MSKVPIDLDRIKKEDLDREIIRIAMIAELDAVSLYEQLESMTDNPNLQAVLQDIALEEKTHVGELQTLLLQFDDEQEKELIKGREEVEELLKK
ncbi:ferritin family protein [uncultured Methanobacterium sp.]|uniref:ferritin family protein n=1 Tax=uncultured Methanobacterium sp. TaxID=176306 RepID=UPI002AA7B1FE|nr:ferritin family protein [uncultured Methanobacterium sp.]